MRSLRALLNLSLVAEMFPQFIFLGSLPWLLAHKDLAGEGNWVGTFELASCFPSSVDL